MSSGNAKYSIQGLGKKHEGNYTQIICPITIKIRHYRILLSTSSINFGINDSVRFLTNTKN